MENGRGNGRKEKGARLVIIAERGIEKVRGRRRRERKERGRKYRKGRK